MKRVTVTMDKLPKSVLELKSEAEKMHSPEGTAILTIAALCACNARLFKRSETVKYRGEAIHPGSIYG